MSLAGGFFLIMFRWSDLRGLIYRQDSFAVDLNMSYVILFIEALLIVGPHVEEDTNSGVHKNCTV